MPHVEHNTQQVKGGLLLSMALLQWKFSQLLEMVLKPCEKAGFHHICQAQCSRGWVSYTGSTVAKAARLQNGVIQKQQNLLLLFLNFAIGGGSNGN